MRLVFAAYLSEGYRHREALRIIKDEMGMAQTKRSEGQKKDGTDYTRVSELVQSTQGSVRVSARCFQGTLTLTEPPGLQHVSCSMVFCVKIGDPRKLSATVRISLEKHPEMLSSQICSWLFLFETDFRSQEALPVRTQTELSGSGWRLLVFAPPSLA